MTLQQITAQQAAERLGCFQDELDYYAWPKVYGSTAGPFGGCGGQSMTTFTLEAWTDGWQAVVFCGDKVIKVVEEGFEPMARF